MKETLLPSRFWLVTFWLKPLLRVFFKYRITGKVPLRGGVIVAANHNSELDPVLFGVGVWRRGRRPYFLAKQQLFKVPVLGAVLRFIRQIPVIRPQDANAGQASSLLEAVRRIKKGQAVICYPEGTLTREPQLWLDKTYPGAVFLSALTGAPIVPAAQWGAHEVLPGKQRKPRLRFRHPYTIKFGAPLTVDRGRLSEEQTQHFQALLAKEINALLGEIRGQTPPEAQMPQTPGASSGTAAETAPKTGKDTDV